MNVKSYSFSFVSTVGNVKRLTIIETRMFLKWMYPLYAPLNKPFDSTILLSDLTQQTYEKFGFLLSVPKLL